MENTIKQIVLPGQVLVTAGNENNTTSREPAEPIVIFDECGDTLWDAVLAQEENRQVLKNTCFPPINK